MRGKGRRDILTPLSLMLSEILYPNIGSDFLMSTVFLYVCILVVMKRKKRPLIDIWSSSFILLRGTFRTLKSRQ